VATTVPHCIEQRAPSAAQVEHASTGSETDLLSDIVVLALLGLLQCQREVPVVLRAAEVGELAQTESKHAVDQRIGELEILAGGHERSLSRRDELVPFE